MTKQIEPPEKKQRLHSSPRLFYLVFVLGIAGIFYTYMLKHHLYDSAALYIGLPFLMAIGLSLTPKTNTAVGATMKGITISLLLAAIVFQEGYVCLIFAGPIFYIIGGAIAFSVDQARKKKDKNTTIQATALATIIALLSLEGTTDLTTFPRNNTVTVEKIIPAEISDVRRKLSEPPQFSDSKPFFLRIFPYPTQSSGQGLNVGDERRVKFVAYKHIWWTKIEGDLVLKVAESNPSLVKFRIAQDDSYLSHYLKWQSSEVTFTPVDDTHTKVRWALSYIRILDPVWYFGPMQRYAVALAAAELIDHAATPSL